jgi:hypothetical protein
MSAVSVCRSASLHLQLDQHCGCLSHEVGHTDDEQREWSGRRRAREDRLGQPQLRLVAEVAPAHDEQTDTSRHTVTGVHASGVDTDELLPEQCATKGGEALQLRLNPSIPRWRAARHPSLSGAAALAGVSATTPRGSIVAHHAPCPAVLDAAAGTGDGVTALHEHERPVG